MKLLSDDELTLIAGASGVSPHSLHDGVWASGDGGAVLGEQLHNEFKDHTWSKTFQAVSEQATLAGTKLYQDGGGATVEQLRQLGGITPFIPLNSIF